MRGSVETTNGTLVDENAAREIKASSQFHVAVLEVGESEALEVHEGEF